MSATSQLTDFSDLYTDLLNRMRQDTSQTTSVNQAKRYINIALYDMHLGFGEKYPWAIRSDVLVTQDDYSTGTVTVSQGSTTVTGSGTAWNTANAFSVNNVRVGGKMVIDGTSDVYEVSAVGSDTSVTLASAYVGSDVSAGDYVYFEDEYSLASDFMRPVSLRSFDRNDEIVLISRTEFRRRFPRNKTAGKPKAATLIDRDFSGSTTRQRRVVFWQPPDDFYNIPYDYITTDLAVSSAGAAQANLSADADEPIVPLYARHAIVFHALYHWYRDRKDDRRSQEAKAEYTDIMLRIVGDQEATTPRPRVMPMVSPYRSAARKPWRGRSAPRYDVNNKFDRFEV